MEPDQLVSKRSTSSEAPDHTIIIEEGKHHVLSPGETMPYRYLKSLGHGNCGVVQAVEDANTGDLYARKIIHLTGHKTLRRQEFENEAKNIRNLLTHHHIIRVFASWAEAVKGFLLSRG